jgi:voltage-gated potassium channel
MHEREHSIAPLWDVAVVLCVTVAAIYLPLQLISTGGEGANDWVLRAIACILILDFVYRAVVTRRGSSSGHGAAAGSMYLWLVLDAIAAVPFVLFASGSAIVLLHLVKLGRVDRVMRQVRRKMLRYYNVLGLVIFSYWLCLSVHWIACGWTALHSYTGEGETVYLDALYWTLSTLTTVGYGDVTPVNNAQKFYAMGVMIVGIGVYGFIVANLANLFANIDPARRGYSRSMERLSSFMYYRNIPQPLQQRIREYYEYVWEKRLDYDESAILSTLPPGLAVEVSMYLKRDIIERVPLFGGASDAFIREIALQLQPLVVTPGDIIVRRGDRGTNMYFISRGTVEILGSDDQSVIATLGDGDFFGEISLFLNQPRTASARAVDYCDLYQLDREVFDRVLAHFPEIGEQIKEKADIRFHRLGNPPQG